MAIEKQTLPYELLIRWRDGVVAGAHVQYITRLVDDGAVVNEQLGAALPVDVGAGKGFPIADLLSQVQTDALIAVDAKTAALAAMTEQRDAAIQARDEAQSALATVQTELDALKASLVPMIDGVPQVVSRFQARAALHVAGLLKSIELMMSHPDADPLMRLAWEDAQNFERKSPTLLALANALELTAEQVDALFIQAAEIKA